MNKHLPECGYSPGQPGFGGINSGIPSTQPYLAPSPCICDRLRACEQRIRLADDDYAYVAGQAEADGRRRGWNEALDAAREAVAALDIGRDVRYGSHVHALAAIDALREKPIGRSDRSSDAVCCP